MSVVTTFPGNCNPHTPGEQPQPEATSIVTVITNASGPACKTFSLNADGDLMKRSAAQISEGEARRVEVAGLAGLLQLIKGLRSNEALTYGVPEVEHARLVTKKAKKLNGSRAICRDREHFRFAKGLPGIWMLDHDPRPGSHVRLSARELDAAIVGVMPELASAARVWRPSSSAFLYTSEGRELIGVGGWRGYVIVDDAAAIPALGAELYQRLWKAEHGYVLPGKAGQLLDRSLVDASVWGPERLDFAAAPILGPGLVRAVPEDLILGGAR